MVSIKDYLKQIEKELRRGDSTEHTHRPALKSLIESTMSGVVATNEPKRVYCGAPDFIVTRGQVPLGYIEAKDVGKPLDEIEKGEQINRYFALGNLMLTDYLEFRWYVGGKRRLIARLAAADSDGKLHEFTSGAEDVAALFQQFLTSTAASIASPKQLAERMAQLARVIRPLVTQSLSKEDANGPLSQIMDGFRKVLLHDLTEEQFADMYTQTLCYGLFTAKCNHSGPDEFTRRAAQYDMPKTNPFLRDLFTHFAGPELDDQPYVWAVDDLTEIMNRSDIAAILEDFGKQSGKRDPVVHFYETFLAAYDPKMREARGVYYTPEPVVSYIVRSVDHILKTDFGLPDGLADASKIAVKTKDGKEEEVHRVQILDPATGTGTFLYGVIDHIHESFISNKGMWSGYVRDHLLPRMFGFELLMAPYAVAHLKLGLQLAETGYDFAPGERLGIYLTNTLEEAFKTEGLPFWGHRIAEEANEAGKVKRDAPVMVVLGNPPYSGHSANKGEWIANLLRGKDTIADKPTGNYFQVDGKPLGERNPKWLNDDYVKFIRFAQWRIEQTGYGVLAFITNHGYLDNPTFRGMRQSLMQTFDRIYVYDLHGNSKKKETAPDGSKDENVFDIQQGVAICIMIKEKAGKQEPVQVFHADLYGLRECKYETLGENDVSCTDWTTAAAATPQHLFQHCEEATGDEYAAYCPVTLCMQVNVLGFQSHRDHFAVDFSQEQIDARIAALMNRQYSDAELRSRYGLPDNRDWQLIGARRKLMADPDWRSHSILCAYRPFDKRWCYFSNVAMDYPRRELLDHVASHQNLCLNVTRQTKSPRWQHALVSDLPTPAVFVEIKDGSTVFPLYLYRAQNASLFDHPEQTDAPGGRRPNLAPEFIADIENKIGMTFITDGKGDLTATFGPEDVFDYIYGVFHSPTYRARYAEFLKIDFPRVPLTSDAGLFRKLAALGGELVALHLMTKTGPNKPSYPVALSGDDPDKDRVENVSYTDDVRVWINKSQYFEGVPKDIWEFHVGGYQVCQKWLKDRKGRALSYEDLEHYRGIVAALGETIRLMAEIDAAIDSHGGWPLR